MDPPNKKTKGGGINQRLRAEVTLEDDEVFAQTGERELPPSILAKLILNLYVWALIYPHLAQQIAAAAVGDLTNHCRRDFENISPIYVPRNATSSFHPFEICCSCTRFSQLPSMDYLATRSVLFIVS